MSCVKILTLVCILMVFSFHHADAANPEAVHGVLASDTVVVVSDTDIKTIFFHENTLLCNYGTIFSLKREKEKVLTLRKCGMTRKVEILGKKKKVKVQERYYYTSELLLKMGSKHPHSKYYDYSKMFTVTNETNEEQYLQFTYFCGKRYNIRIILHPKGSINVPYHKFAFHKRIDFLGRDEFNIQVKGGRFIKVFSDKLEVSKTQSL